MNAILSVNLVWSALRHIRFLKECGPSTDLERWETNYLAMHAMWAVIVVIVFPPLFGYI